MPVLTQRMSTHASLLKRAFDDAEDENPMAKKLRVFSPSPTLKLPESSNQNIKLQEECLNDVAVPFVRAALSKVGKQLLKDASACKVFNKVEVNTSVNDASPALVKVDTSGCELAPPTHVMAVSGPNSSKIVCYPIHSLLVEASCTRFPTLPRLYEGAKDDSMLPFVPCKLPYPPAFPLVLAYIYTLDLATFERMFDITRLSIGLEELLARAQLAQGLWCNLKVLGMNTGKEAEIFRILLTFMADVDELQKQWRELEAIDEESERSSTDEEDSELDLSDTIFFTDVSIV